jgi:hypothetical protein
MMHLERVGAFTLACGAVLVVVALIVGFVLRASSRLSPKNANERSP